MKSIYVCNVSTPDEQAGILPLPNTAPRNPFKGAEQVRTLHADPTFGAGADEEPLPLPATYQGLGEVES